MKGYILHKYNVNIDFTIFYSSQCIPQRLRTDHGTETVLVAAFQILFSYGDLLAHLYGSSMRNQRIENWWLRLRYECADFWIAYFAALKHDGHFDVGNSYHKRCSQFVFGGIVRNELILAARLWNHHTVRKNPLWKCSGAPLWVHQNPEKFNGKQCGKPLPLENVLEKAGELGIELANLNDPFELNVIGPVFQNFLERHLGVDFSLNRTTMKTAFILLSSETELERQYFAGNLGDIENV